MTVNTYVPSINAPLVIYHSNCADGFSAAWCFHQFFPGQMQFYPGIYQENPPDVSNRDVFLVDFSYKRAVVEAMLMTARSVTLIDHHKTAIEDLASVNHPNFVRYINLDMSGATLAWDFCVEQTGMPAGSFQRPPLLGHIEDRDLWRFKLPNTREIQANVFSYEYTFENWDRLMCMNEAELLSFSVAGAALERKHHKDIKELVNVCSRFMVIGDYVVPVASLPYTFTSDAGHYMASQWKDGTEFAACYWDTADHRIFSLRSCDNDMDVSEIAKEYGGGGHKNAAGFRVERSHPLACA